MLKGFGLIWEGEIEATYLQKSKKGDTKEVKKIKLAD